MIDLAIQPPDDSGPKNFGAMMSTPDKVSAPKYPTLRLSDDASTQLGLGGAAIGDTFEVTLTVRAKRLGVEDYSGPGDSTAHEFDVLSATDAATPVDGEAEEAAEPADEPEPETTPKPKAKAPKILSPRSLPGGKEAFGDDDEEED